MLGLCLVFLAPSPAGARGQSGGVRARQAAYDVLTGEPELQLLALKLASARLRLEYELQSRRVAYDGNPTVDQDLQYLAAMADVLVRGSFLHPNLLHFSLSTSLGLDEQEQLNAADTTTTEGSVQSYNANAEILKAKPYGFTLFASKQRQRREYDFFNRVRVEGERYGGIFGYDHSVNPLSITLERLREEEPDLTRPRLREEDSAFVSLKHIRASPELTELSYAMDTYLHQQEDSTTLDGRRQQLRLTDARDLGTRGNRSLRSNARYAFREDLKTERETHSLSIAEDLRTGYSATLSDRIAYSFTDSRSGDVVNRRHSGSWLLTHKLYKSLRSSLSVNTLLGDTEGTDASSETVRYGGGIGEQYTKRLADVGRLNISLGVRTFEDKHVSEGGSTDVIDERHTLTDGSVELLNRAGVDTSTIVVRDGQGTTLYQQSLDYDVIPVGEYTEIRRVPGGDIPNGGTVLVSYSAGDETEDRTSVMDRRLAASVDLFKDRVSIYGRVHDLESESDRQLAIADALDQVVGTRLSFANLSAGGEYQDRSAESASYTATRTYQSCSLRLGRRSKAQLRASQSERNYRDSASTYSTQSYILKYNNYPRSGVWLSVQGGLHRERGDSRDRDRATARASLRYTYRQLSAAVAYEFEEEDIKEDSRSNREEYISVRIIRRF